MESQRSLKLVVGYQPQFGWPKHNVEKAGLLATVATVLSTYRSTNPDMVLDHDLWLVCAYAVTETVQADQTRVFAENPARFLNRLFRRRVEPDIGSRESYAARIATDPDAENWAQICWYKEDRLVAAAVNEPWYRVGGPHLYHDSYTTCFFVALSAMPRLVEAIRRRVDEVGGFVEETVNIAEAYTG
jgi:hypothetical protein